MKFIILHTVQYFAPSQFYERASFNLVVNTENQLETRALFIMQLQVFDCVQ